MKNNNIEITTEEMTALTDAMFDEIYEKRDEISTETWDSIFSKIDGVVKIPEVPAYVSEMDYEDIVFYKSYFAFKYGNPTLEDIDVMDSAYRSGYLIELF